MGLLDYLDSGSSGVSGGYKRGQNALKGLRGGYNAPKPPASIARPVSSPSSFSKVGGAIAPVQNYQPPVQNYQPYQPPAQPVYNNAVGAPISQNNFQGTSSMAESAPPPPPKPMTYDQFTDDMASTDSIFMDQKSAYANALKKFIADNTRQQGILQGDSKVALEGVGKNRVNGLTGLSEDFASRGLANSGMFTKELDDADGRYDQQETQVKTGLKNGIDDLNFRKAKYEGEYGNNGTAIQAARREAFARLAASQNLT